MTSVAQVLAIVALAPLLQGCMKTLRARLSGRQGPSPLQAYRDLAKLWRKEALLPDGVSVLALIAPGLVFGVATTFAAAIPLANTFASNLVDVVSLAMLLALGRFVTALVALDTRSGFAGMAASREMTFASLAEPALLIALVGGAASGHGTALQSLAGVPFGIAGLLAIVALFLVLLSETARVPIDNQESHYELTMIHEGLVLEYGGWQLALMNLAAQIRQLCFLLLASFLLPAADWQAHWAWVVALGIAITIVETVLAKVRLFEVPQLLTSALILALASICLRIGVLPS
jgi:formate hydrogenlyase subunit 4